jgi:hypothetical protein
LHLCACGESGAARTTTAGGSNSAAPAQAEGDRDMGSEPPASVPDPAPGGSNEGVSAELPLTPATNYY